MIAATIVFAGRERVKEAAKRPFLAHCTRLPYDRTMGQGLPLRALAPLVGGALLAVAGAARADPPWTEPDEEKGARATRVLIVSEDGLRPDYVSSQRLPWHEALWQHGAYSWKARTIRTASTLPSHAAMLSGVDVRAHGLSWNNWRPHRGFIKAPTIFGEAEQHGMKTAMFVGKNKLRHIAAPGTVGVYDRPGYYCKKVADEAAAYLVAEKPPLAFVHFSDPDEAGHAAGWTSERYRHAVLQSDRCLGIILDALEKAELLDGTLVIVSADHGGHNRTHSGAKLVDREIPWIARGPGVREGYQIQGAISTVDTAATALYALGLPLSSTLEGKPVKEIFADGAE
jgi:arylsulfatase A-like enzyme